jgi:endonuclease YncB( thermonuclease family)
MGIDAPEYVQQCKDKHKKLYPCGIDSAKYLEKLISNQQITCRIHKKDQYDRDLCTCYVGNTDINREMVLSGNAITYLETPYHQEQTDAKQHKRGLWQGRFMQPRLFRRLKVQQKAYSIHHSQLLRHRSCSKIQFYFQHQAHSFIDLSSRLLPSVQ